MLKNISIWRNILRPALAFVGASVAAGFVITLFFFVLSLADSDREMMSVSGIAASLVVSFVVAFFVAFIAVVPTVILVMVLRLTRLPRLWGDAVGGGLVGLGIMQFVGAGTSAILDAPHPVALLFGGAGVIAGVSYWLLAGRPRPPYSQA